MLKFNVSPELREQIINIIDDLVDKICLDVVHKEAMYEEFYKSLWDELGIRRFEYVDHRNEIFNLLREIPSEKFFTCTEHLLKG